jgi:hypothetical protein
MTQPDGCLCGSVRYDAVGNPESLTPKGRVYWSEHLAWLEIGDDLPKFAEIDGSLQKDN